jgi:hypothetical protein
MNLFVYKLQYSKGLHDAFHSFKEIPVAEIISRDVMSVKVIVLALKVQHVFRLLSFNFRPLPVAENNPPKYILPNVSFCYFKFTRTIC